MLLVWGLYSSAVTLPFYTDDANHYRFFQTVESAFALWTGQTWSPYYRPFVYTVWWLLIRAQGGFDPVAHHFVNLPIYGLGGTLLSLLVLRLMPTKSPRKWWLAAAAGCVFVTFPFHYQAVFQVGSLFHLMMTTAVLSVLLLSLRFIHTGDRKAYAAMLVMAIIAVFSHEMGFVVALLLIVAGLMEGSWRLHGRWVATCLPVSLIAALYVALWLLLPRVGTESGLRFSQSMVDNAAVLMQPFFYPLAALIRPFVEGKASPALLFGLFGVWTTVGLYLAWRASRLALCLALLGIVWYLSGIALPVVMLQPDYVWDSPRLTMLASVGAILFFIALLKDAALNAPTVRRGALVIVGVVLIGFNVAFIIQRREEYLLMRDYTWALIAEMKRANAPTEGALLVNAPNYLEAPAGARTFLAQAQFASFMSPEVDYRDYLEVNSAGVQYLAPIEAIGVGRILLHQAHTFVIPTPLIDGEALLARLRMPRPIVVTQHNGDHFFPVWVGRYGATMPETRIAQFAGERVHLTGVTEPEIAASHLRLALQWRVEEPIDAKVFVHVLSNGELIAQGDGHVWGDLYPFSAWQPGESQIDRREIVLPENIALDDIWVFIGLYNEHTGERYALEVASDQWYVQDNALRIYP